MTVFYANLCWQRWLLDRLMANTAAYTATSRFFNSKLFSTICTIKQKDKQGNRYFLPVDLLWNLLDRDHSGKSVGHVSLGWWR